MPSNKIHPIIEEVNITYFALVESQPPAPSPKMNQLNARVDKLMDTVNDIVNDTQGGMASKWGNSRLDHLGYDGDEDEEPPSRAGASIASPSRGMSPKSFSVKGSATEVARKMRNMSGVPARLVRQYMDQRQQRPSIQEREEKLRKDAIKGMKHVKPSFQRTMDEHFLNQEEKRLMAEVKAVLDNVERLGREQREESLQTDAIDAMSHVKPKFQKRLDKFDCHCSGT